MGLAPHHPLFWKHAAALLVLLFLPDLGKRVTTAFTGKIGRMEKSLRPRPERYKKV